MKPMTRLFPALLALWLAGCDAGPKSGRGFVFPEGDGGRGQQAFVAMKCFECHRVDGVTDLPAPTVGPERIVVLGGTVAHVKSYGELVTAVIHPDHERTAMPPGPGEPRVAMPNVNQTMTVTQMLDIVTFLQPHYLQLEPLYPAHDIR